MQIEGGAPRAAGTELQGRFFWPLCLLATLFFMWGFVTSMNDVLIPHLKAVFAFGYVQSILVQTAFFLAYLVVSIPAAKLVEARGYKGSIVIGLAIMGAACLLFVPAAGLGPLPPTYGVFLAALFLLAGGITILQVAANPYVAVLGSAKTSSSRLNLVQALNSLGTAIAPQIGGMFILARSATGTAKSGAAISLSERLHDAGAVQAPYVVIALVLFAIAVGIGFARLPKVPTHPETDSAHTDSVRRHPLLILGIIGIFVYVGAEVSVGSYMVSYVSSGHVLRITPAAAAGYVSLYWTCAMVGRFAGALIIRWVNPALVLGFNCLAAVAAIVISMATTGQVALWAIVLVGLCNSIMFPTIFTLAIRGLGALTGRASGYLITAIFGGAVLPVVQGLLADMPGIGLTLSFFVPAVCYLFIFYFAWRCFRARPEVEDDVATAAVRP